ncbi:hypothetical protein [Cellulomonas sp. PhB143]|uniref:hypothetical protein n=1 Tax=Cellulomonas sp. PhB143 TaxID=2485186 RepID=UPI000F49047D|nr:hypothetical protein [Cellulomonas sp. PhB143]ROS74333.1 hypothetical protein EDF32_2074 [Cellulomonas sp. PhB143]
MDRNDDRLPRSVLLALWAADVVGGRSTPGEGARAVQRDDEPHALTGDPPAAWSGSVEALLEDLAGLAVPGMPGMPGMPGVPAVEVCAVLPVPGDPAGAPAVVGVEATDAREAVLVGRGQDAWALVPEVEAFGSAWEPGHLVTWRVTPVPPWTTAVHGTLGSPADAERDLRTALTTAVDALDRLDVARWREDAAEQIAALRARPSGRGLPSRLDARRARVLEEALRLRAIVALATDDDGGAVNLWQADQRTAALRDVDRTARRAVSTATLAAVQRPASTDS